MKPLLFICQLMITVTALGQSKARDLNEPEYIGSNDSGTIGYRHNKIFIHKEDKAWKLLFTLPMQLEPEPHLDLTDDDCVLYQRSDDSLFYFDLSGSLQKQTSKEAMLASFVKSGIRQVFFSRSSFHALQIEWEKIQYKNLGAEFGDTILTRSTETDFTRKWLPDNRDRIDAKDVSDFINQLPALYHSTHMTSLEELGFTENDFKQCKKDIQKFRESLLKDEKKRKRSEEGFVFAQNNLDFDRLFSLVDTIQHMDNKRIYKLLIHLKHSYGSRIDERSFWFVNNNNEVLNISSTYSGFYPHAFHFPWYIELNGCRIESVDMRIVRFIEKVYPTFLNDSPGKMNLLYEFVKMLY